MLLRTSSGFLTRAFVHRKSVSSLLLLTSQKLVSMQILLQGMLLVYVTLCPCSIRELEFVLMTLTRECTKTDTHLRSVNGRLAQARLH